MTFEITTITSKKEYMYINLNIVRHVNSYLSFEGKEERKEMFYLTMHSTHFISGYMESDIW